MKKKYIGYIADVLMIVVVIFMLTQIFPYEFTLQYLDKDMNVHTEVFTSTKEFNKRAEELKEDSVFYWIN